jgi:hypothetical protein
LVGHAALGIKIHEVHIGSGHQRRVIDQNARGDEFLRVKFCGGDADKKEEGDESREMQLLHKMLDKDDAANLCGWGRRGNQANAVFW